MNRRSFPEEIDAPQLNSRGRYIHRGHDASTSRQLARLVGQMPEIGELGPILEEDYELPVGDDLYVLTRDKNNSYISSAIAHLGANCVRAIYWVSQAEKKEYEADFSEFIMREIEAHTRRYPEAS